MGLPLLRAVRDAARADQERRAQADAAAVPGALKALLEAQERHARIRAALNDAAEAELRAARDLAVLIPEGSRLVCGGYLLTRRAQGGQVNVSPVRVI